jgi:hypothetical protein
LADWPHVAYLESRIRASFEKPYKKQSDILVALQQAHRFGARSLRDAPNW